MTSQKRIALSSSESSQYFEKGVEGDDDLMTAILARLPPKSIFKFRYVSKRWNNIISNPFFVKSYYSGPVKEKNGNGGEPRLLGYIMEYPYNAWFNHSTRRTVYEYTSSILSPDGVEYPRVFGFRHVNSSNGLILYANLDHINGEPACKYQILNPLTKRSLTLEGLKWFGSFVGMALVCEENTRDLALNYKIVEALDCTNLTTMIRIFSSSTRAWTNSLLKRTGKLTCLYESPPNPLVVKGVIYWVQPFYVVVYDGNNNYGSVNKCIQLIKLPKYESDLAKSFSVGGDGDDLWFCILGARLKMSMLPRGVYDTYSKSFTTVPRKEWILMHNIRCETLFRDILLLDREEDKKENKPTGRGSGLEILEMHKLVKSTHLVRLIPWKRPHVALLKIDKRMYMCNLDNQSVKLYQEYCSSYDLKTSGVLSCYFEPVCLSSYTF